MHPMPVKIALAAVLREMHQMSPAQLRQELLAHRHGELATAFREAQQFIAQLPNQTADQAVTAVHGARAGKATILPAS